MVIEVGGLYYCYYLIYSELVIFNIISEQKKAIRNGADNYTNMGSSGTLNNPHIPKLFEVSLRLKLSTTLYLVSAFYSITI